MITQQPAAQALFEISAEETKTILSQAPETLLFDVREQNEWDAGHVEIADHMPLSALLEGHRPDLAKDSAIILYCQRGMRSMQALQIMKSQGYNNVKSVAEGYSILGQIL